MVGEPEAQTELPLENKMKITKKQLRKMEKVVNYWPDLERLRGKMKLRKRGKLKEVKN